MRIKAATALLFGIFSVSANQTLAQDASYNGLYPALSCRVDEVLYCGPTACVKKLVSSSSSKACEGEYCYEHCLSMAKSKWYRFYRTNELPNGAEQAPAPVSFTLDEIAPAALNRPLYWRISLAKNIHATLSAPRPGAPAQFSLIEEILPKKNVDYYGDAIFDKRILIGVCQPTQQPPSSKAGDVCEYLYQNYHDPRPNSMR
jgi:hypothetical protein